MKKTIFALALLVVLSLTACGTSNSAALQQENEDLRQQIAALESENAALTQENSGLKAENTALDDTAPESGDEESNPIDRFFDSVQLLSNVHAFTTLFDHGDDAAQMAISPLEALDDRLVTLVGVRMAMLVFLLTHGLSLGPQ